MAFDVYVHLSYNIRYLKQNASLDVFYLYFNSIDVKAHFILLVYNEEAYLE